MLLLELLLLLLLGVRTGLEMGDRDVNGGLSVAEGVG